MDFAGNKYTYISKKKVEKIRGFKSQNQNQNLSVIKEKPENFEMSSNLNQVKLDVGKKEKRSGRSRSRSNEKNRRSRSNSIELNVSGELDEVYSCDESEDKNSDNEDDEDDYKPKKKSEKKVKSQKESLSKKDKKIKFNLASLKNTEDRVHEHEIDTNVLSIKFAFLSEKVGYATGDPTFCKNCTSVLNKNSRLKPSSDEKDDDVTIWECEFCNFTNKIQIEPEEIPKSECVDYFVMSKSQVKSSGLNYSDDKTILFVFDVSGSMCVTTPIKGKHKIKGNTIDKEYQELMKFSDGSDQFYDQGCKGKTYISRMQCLQAAIESNITLMKESAPNV